MTDKIKEAIELLEKIINTEYASDCMCWADPVGGCGNVLTLLRSVCYQRADIITHGDGDGTIAAAIAKKNGAIGKVHVTQPFLLHKLSNLERPTVILDMAIDNKNPEATLEWASRNKDNIVLWVDHHQGGEQLVEILGEKFVYDAKAPSCPDLMFFSGYFQVLGEWRAAANACDSPVDHAATDLSLRYNAAFKVALVALQAGDKNAVKTVQDAFVEELLSGKESMFITEKVEKYQVLMTATEKAAKDYKDLVKGYVVVTTIENQAAADVTALLFSGYKLAPVAVIQTLSSEDGSEITIVATNDKSRNLVEYFHLGSGNPQRIVLMEGGHEEHLVQISNILKR